MQGFAAHFKHVKHWTRSWWRCVQLYWGGTSWNWYHNEIHDLIWTRSWNTWKSCPQSITNSMTVCVLFEAKVPNSNTSNIGLEHGGVVSKWSILKLIQYHTEMHELILTRRQMKIMYLNTINTVPVCVFCAQLYWGWFHLKLISDITTKYITWLGAHEPLLYPNTNNSMAVTVYNFEAKMPISKHQILD